LQAVRTVVCPCGVLLHLWVVSSSLRTRSTGGEVMTGLLRWAGLPFGDIFSAWFMGFDFLFNLLFLSPSQSDILSYRQRLSDVKFSLWSMQGNCLNRNSKLSAGSTLAQGHLA